MEDLRIRLGSRVEGREGRNWRVGTLNYVCTHGIESTLELCDLWGNYWVIVM